MPIKCALLFALLAIDGWAILDLGIGASLTLVADECSDDIAVLACRWLAVRLYVLFAFLADRAGAALCGLLELRPAVCALHHWERTATFLTKVFTKHNNIYEFQRANYVVLIFGLMPINETVCVGMYVMKVFLSVIMSERN